MIKIQQPIQSGTKEKRQHVLAALRKAIYGNSKFAGQRYAHKSLGIPTDTCASIESGRRNRKGRVRYPLTERIAKRVSAWTGISPGWLLAGDSETPMAAIDGAPYTRDVFDRKCHERESVNAALAPQRKLKNEFLVGYAQLCARVGQTLLAAGDAKEHGFAAWKLGEVITQLGKSYPTFEARTVDGKQQDSTGPQRFYDCILDTMKQKGQATNLGKTIFNRFNLKVQTIMFKQALDGKPTGKAAKQPASKPAAARRRHAKRNQRR